MPIKKEREYRALAAPLTAQSATKLIQTEYYVEGYATFCMDTGTPPEMQPRGYGIFRRRHMGRHLP